MPNLFWRVLRFFRVQHQVRLRDIPTDLGRLLTVWLFLFDALAGGIRRNSFFRVYQ